jgi:hypothetical protein
MIFMTENKFTEDNDRISNTSTISPGGDFGETDSPDGTAPDISNPLSSPSYGPDYPGHTAHEGQKDSSGFDESDMRGLAEHGYDGTGQLQSAVDADKTSTMNSPDRPPGHDDPSTDFLSSSPQTQPGSVMRNNDEDSQPVQTSNEYDAHQDRVPEDQKEEPHESSSGGMMENLKAKMEEAKTSILHDNK